MVPARVLSLAVFSAAVVTAVWWLRRRPPVVTVVPQGERSLPWIDVI